MERVNRILNHPTFCRILAELKELERERDFCGHGLDHLLTVGRLMYIYSREEGLSIERELLYGTALLHDIGRAEQYRTGVAHEVAGIPIAESILRDCGFGSEEILEVLEAINSHRRSEAGEGLGHLLYQADKKSRPCFACPAIEQCNWPEEKKNLSLEF